MISISRFFSFLSHFAFQFRSLSLLRLRCKHYIRPKWNGPTLAVDVLVLYLGLLEISVLRVGVFSPDGIGLNPSLR